MDGRCKREATVTNLEPFRDFSDACIANNSLKQSEVKPSQRSCGKCRDLLVINQRAQPGIYSDITEVRLISAASARFADPLFFKADFSTNPGLSKSMQP